MQWLSNNWIFEPIFDFEYKTYQLRAYLLGVNNKFSEHKFYPYLSDVMTHLDEVKCVLSKRNEIESSIKTDLEKLDLRRAKLIRKKIPESPDCLAELNDIIDFAHINLEDLYEKGRAEFENTSEGVQISPLGILSEKKSEGYLFFRRPTRTRIYSYFMRMVRRPNDFQSFMDVQTKYIDEVNTGMLTNFNELKWKFIKASPSALNAYLIESNTELPYSETLLPIAKKYLIKYAVSA